MQRFTSHYGKLELTVKHYFKNYSIDLSLTLFRVLEEVRHERFLGLLHELYDALLDGILVLVEPTVDVVLHL